MFQVPSWIEILGNTYLKQSHMKMAGKIIQIHQLLCYGSGYVIEKIDLESPRRSTAIA